jgi:hypothetical protein
MSQQSRSMPRCRISTITKGLLHSDFRIDKTVSRHLNPNYGDGMEEVKLTKSKMMKAPLVSQLHYSGLLTQFFYVGFKFFLDLVELPNPTPNRAGAITEFRFDRKIKANSSLMLPLAATLLQNKSRR